MKSVQVKSVEGVYLDPTERERERVSIRVVEKT
jgi:hypothetical protein